MERLILGVHTWRFVLIKVAPSSQSTASRHRVWIMGCAGSLVWETRVACLMVHWRAWACMQNPSKRRGPCLGRGALNLSKEVFSHSMQDLKPMTQPSTP